MALLQLADTADREQLEQLRAAAEGLQQDAVDLVLRSHGAAKLDQVPKARVAAVLRDLQVCSPGWPPLPRTSPLDL